MTNDDQPAGQELSAGQLWRLKGRYIFIVAMESLSVRFRLMDSHDERDARTLSGDVDTLGRYLFSRNGELVPALR